MNKYKKWAVIIENNIWFFETFRDASTFARTEELDGKTVEIFKLVYADGEVVKE